MKSYLTESNCTSVLRTDLPCPSGHPAKVAILLCTYQGEHFLSEQLESFLQQTHSHWEIWASDDGSQDRTLDLLKTYQQNWPAGRLSLQRGPSQGFAANFFSLINRPEMQADYYAYSDQDDIWEKDKLERAIQWLTTIPATTPALYCSRTQLIDSCGHPIHPSPRFTKQPCFQNALAQNIGGGNTMVFNQATRQLLSATTDPTLVVSHDWWTYILVTGVGGIVHYDEHPSLRYRQHRTNLVGANTSWSARCARIRMLHRGDFHHWNSRHILALHQCQSKLTPINRKILEHFIQARSKSGLLSRLVHLYRSGIYRQTLLGNLGLIAATIFRRL